MSSDTPNNQVILAPVGGRFTVRLTGVPGAGYIWIISSKPDALQLLKTGNQQATSPSAPGDPSIQVFEFRVLEPGEHEIKFVLKRVWEDDGIEWRTIKVKTN
jgi:predicted secreted protein